MTRAILLDAHGTLVSLEPPAPLLQRELSERFGVEVSRGAAEAAIAAEVRYYRAHIGEGRDPESVGLLRGRCAEALRAALAAERLLQRAAPEELTEALIASLVFHPYPEVPAVLRRLRGLGLRTVVVSNWDASLPDVLEGLGLAGCVDGIVASAAVGAAKPDPEIFSAALRLVGAEPGEALHVGDSLEEDVGGARAAGIEPVLVVRDGRSAPSGVRAIRSLAELPALLGAGGTGP